MSEGTIAMSKTTRIELLQGACDLRDGRSWGEFHAIYYPLIFGYLRGLRIAEHDADEVTQEVFRRLMQFLPRFTLDRGRGRFRTYLWQVTRNTLVDWIRRQTVRDRAEGEWVRQFREANESESRKQQGEFLMRHRRRILEVALPRVRATVSAKAWACFEGRLMHRRPAAELAAELETTANCVFANASRVLAEVRRRCAEIEGELGDDWDDDLS